MDKMTKNPEVLVVCSDDELLKNLIEVCGHPPGGTLAHYAISEVKAFGPPSA